ncbi:MAG: hypothetical protein JSW06_04700 [Thermoplasmatales archaeon]|nr:MAG: hypothetical protein JSW06_04700 [Thermoplasmatales archaeon]
MKKKSLSYVAVGLLLISSFAAIGIGKEAVVNKETKNPYLLNEETINLQFLEPDINEQGTYVEINVEGANGRLSYADEPMLPIYRTTLSFPFGTEIVDIECLSQDVKTMVLPKKIAPAPKPIVLEKGETVLENSMDEAIYNSDELFPDNWFSYITGGGLDRNSEHKTFLNIRVYPVRYNPTMDTIYYVENLELKITYNEPLTNPFPENSEFDMVIIAPSKFSKALDKLVDHKNDVGVNTTLKKTEDIYDEYTGVDKPEKIKYFIKDAIETDGIKYVLLVGGMKSYIFGTGRDDANQGTATWHLPVRYSNLDDTVDLGFICDLYYADIYNGVGNFSTWDSNENGVFAEWDAFEKDIIHLYPDVYLGRLACRNKIEVKIMVNKIINYEKEPANPSWFNTMVAVGGESFNDTTNYLEGEEICNKSLSYMTDFNPVKIYASNQGGGGLVPTTKDIVKTVKEGCGFLFFAGFGNALNWATHWPGDFETWVEGINVFKFPRLSNKEKLPVCIVAGSHNCQFNVTILASLSNPQGMHTYGVPIPECWGWWLTRKIGGGSIATIGETAIGYGMMGEGGDLDGDGINEPDCVEGLSGYINTQFFKTYNDSVDILGKVWGDTINKYLDTFPGMGNLEDCKMVEEWVLLGDPSLKIGGYT